MSSNENYMVTHNGIFHADDVFAYVVLTTLFPLYKLLRTRSKNVIDNAKIVFDVGEMYNPETDRFDHHQGDIEMRDNGFPYSSFGLVWKKYGLQYCDYNQEITDIINSKLVIQIDAIDNGIEILTKKFKEINIVSISHLISDFNQNWNEYNYDTDPQFIQAAKFAKQILNNLKRKVTGNIEAKDYIIRSISKAEDPRLIILDEFAPWLNEVISNEQAIYVVFQDINKEWRLQCVPVDKNNRFTNRKILPSEWANKSPDELNNIIGIDDAVFCHKGLFIAGTKSRESILKMAEIALNN